MQVDDLRGSSIPADQKLGEIFQRWIDSDKEVTWEKILEVCEDCPDKFGKAETELKFFLLTERAHKRYMKSQ